MTNNYCFYGIEVVPNDIIGAIFFSGSTNCSKSKHCWMVLQIDSYNSNYLRIIVDSSIFNPDINSLSHLVSYSCGSVIDHIGMFCCNFIECYLSHGITEVFHGAVAAGRRIYFRTAGNSIIDYISWRSSG